MLEILLRVAPVCFRSSLQSRSFNLAFPEHVKIVEVGPRDGLQNEAVALSANDKQVLVEALADTGLRAIEAGSFVSPKWVPQMAGSDEVFAGLNRRDGVTYSALTPNLKGLERALEVGVDEVAVFAAASQSFSQKNINCSIAESLQRFEPVVELARRRQLPVRGYVSCVIGCPYEGGIAAHAVAEVSASLLDMGCYEVSLGDTIGVGTPLAMAGLIDVVSQRVPVAQLAVHCHDTYGQALANIYACLERGVAVVDSSVAGLGGCPYARGATGNVATEDVVYMLDGMGIATGIDLAKLIAVGNNISQRLGRDSQSRVARARTSDAA